MYNIIIIYFTQLSVFTRENIVLSEFDSHMNITNSPVHARYVPPEESCSVSWTHFHSINKHRVTLKTNQTHLIHHVTRKHFFLNGRTRFSHFILLRKILQPEHMSFLNLQENAESNLYPTQENHTHFQKAANVSFNHSLHEHYVLKQPEERSWVVLLRLHNIQQPIKFEKEPPSALCRE